MNHQSLFAENAKLIQVSNKFIFTEGPIADIEGNVFFTDQPNNRIMRWDVNGEISIFMENAGRANGMYFDNSGNLLACADQDNQIWSISMDKKVHVLLTDVDGKKLNGPNDLWVDQNDGIYFTDPFYKRDYWNRTEKEIEGEKLYYFSKIKGLKVVDDELNKPNGIIGSPDNSKLFVADIGAGKTYVYEINGDGLLSNKKLFCEMGSDGMTLDEKGNLYLTGKGVTIFNPAGQQIEHISIDEPWTANICFGGKKFKTLFITAMKSVYTLEMNVKGAR